MAGNLLSYAAGSSYQWDSFSQMSRMTNGAEDWVFVYGPGDERLWSYRVGGGGSIWSLRGEDGKTLREYTSHVGWGAHQDYVYRDGVLAVGLFGTGGQRHYTLDHLGTVRLVTDGFGTQLGRHDYNPFGGEKTALQEAERMKWAGHERDLYAAGAADDLDYMHARHYSPVTGRFLSFDPVGGNPRAPQSWNRYAYVLGNPLKYVDPFGLQAQANYGLAWGLTVGSNDSTWFSLSDINAADRLLLDAIQFRASLSANERRSGSRGFEIFSRVGAMTAPVARGADLLAQGINAWTGIVDVGDALIEGDLTELGVAVAFAVVPGPLDRAAGAAIRHVGFSKSLATMKNSSLQKTIRSLEGLVAAHMAKIAARPGARETAHWRGEISTFQQQLSLARSEAARRGLP